VSPCIRKGTAQPENYKGSMSGTIGLACLTIDLATLAN
jgi:hypothetical protein